ncbi:mechanosensitive ion channel family protein [Paucibacter sp. JuS9]|uniref:mechanosensitive ion channel family protein n=1 Tax=Roseateles TaxID=93681 RepID=UPI002FE6608F
MPTLARLLLTLLITACAMAQAEQAATPEATMRWLNRDIVVLRASLAGAAPQARVERALVRIANLPAAELDAPLRALPFKLGDASGQQILLGDHLLFSLLEGDLEAEAHTDNLEALTRRTLGRLEEAREAWHRTRDRPLLWQGLARAGLVSLGASLLLWGLAFGMGRMARAIELRRRRLSLNQQMLDWRELAARLVQRLLQIVHWLMVAGLLYAWLRLVLGAFALTEPLAHELQRWWAERLDWLLQGVAGSVPGLVTIAMVLLLTRAVSDAMGYFFDAVQRGRISVPLLHPETTPATRRIVGAGVWVLGIAIAYPYLPGANTDAFKGLSVLIGLMVTLGATGIVTQAMSGLLVIYARALRKGDYVAVGSVEGVVIEVAPLATKLLNLRNEEITIPNAVLIASPIHNYSKLAESQGTLLSTQVTIGYDAPWRQVHQLLESAARATEGLRAEPAPRVFQRALSDFYVEYELIVSIDRPIERVAVLSRLHAAIQDAFNAAGVQIMSPHFRSQPEQPVLAPPLHSAPAPAGASNPISPQKETP